MMKFVRRFSWELGLGLILFVAINAGLSGLVYGQGNPNRNPVAICHATHSDSNPFTSQTVDDDAVDGIGQGSGQSADHNRDDHQDGEDIIPPGAWDADGRNWNAANEAIWNNNCNSVT